MKRRPKQKDRPKGGENTFLNKYKEKKKRGCSYCAPSKIIVHKFTISALNDSAKSDK